MKAEARLFINLHSVKKTPEEKYDEQTTNTNLLGSDGGAYTMFGHLQKRRCISVHI
jgi:hypothetical protein